MLSLDDVVLLVVDVQEKFIPVIHESDKLIANIATLVKGADILGIPVIWTEQYPQGLGLTVSPLAELMKTPAIAKRSFSCCGELAFNQALAKVNKHHILLAGIEAHICLYQTAQDLLAANFELSIVADAVSSRTAANKEIGLSRIISQGAKITSVEMVLFELLKVAQGPSFKAISKLVK